MKRYDIYLKSKTNGNVTLFIEYGTEEQLKETENISVLSKAFEVIAVPRAIIMSAK